MHDEKEVQALCLAALDPKGWGSRSGSCFPARFGCLLRNIHLAPWGRQRFPKQGANMLTLKKNVSKMALY